MTPVGASYSWRERANWMIWGFTEWLHGKALSQHGMRGQSWNAAGFLLAYHAVYG